MASVEREAQGLEPFDVEPGQDLLVAGLVERVVARQESHRIGRQRGPECVGGPVGSKRGPDAGEALGESSAPRKPERAEQAAQASEDRIATRRAQPADRWQERLIEQELPG